MMTTDEAIRRFEKQLTAARVVLDSGFGTQEGECDTVYRHRKEMAEIALNALRHTAWYDKAMEEGQKTAYDENGIPYLVEAEGSEAKHIIELLAAESQGRLVELPCKAGDTLFCFDRNNGKILNRAVDRFTVGKDGYISIWTGTTTSFSAAQIGKIVFLTRKEAEVALSERGGNND